MNDFERLYEHSKLGEAVLLNGNQMVGCVYNRKFIKRIHKQHLMEKPPAIAIDKIVFIQHIQSKCDRIFVLEMDSQIFYSASVDQFTRHSFYLDRRHGGQLALEMQYWGKNTGVTHQVEMAI